MHVCILSLGVVVASWVDDESVIRVDVSCLVHRVISTTQSPGRVAPATSPGPIVAMAVKLVLLVWSWRKREVHEMGDGGLSLPTVWILHTEQLSFCILIQRLELLSLLMLGLAILLVPCSRARSSVAATAATSPLSTVVEEGLGCLRTCWAALT